ncbi:MAG: dTMP kinase [Fibrobacteres bacterium CG2_30_45_31]|nr:MAG: dTMP kinase [Fibrobacteres bacterium CG2_30_45_31]
MLKTASRFFCLEGIDGSGKTTQMDLLEQSLRGMGYECVRVREPGGSRISEAIRALLLDPAYKGLMGDRAELLLYNAARAQVIEEVIQPALNAGIVVLADRFAWSTLAYQGFGRGLNTSMVEKLSEITCGECFPELTIVLDMDVKEGRLRMASEGKQPDRLEAEKEDFFERVRKGYQQISKEFPECVSLVNASQSRESMHEIILQMIKSKL